MESNEGKKLKKETNTQEEKTIKKVKVKKEESPEVHVESEKQNGSLKQEEQMQENAG